MVTAGQVTLSVDEALTEGGRITGRVTNAVTGEPIEDVEACARDVCTIRLAPCAVRWPHGRIIRCALWAPVFLTIPKNWGKCNNFDASVSRVCQLPKDALGRTDVLVASRNGMRILISGSSVFLRSCLELGNAVRPRLAGRDEQTASPRCKGCSGNRNPARETEGSPNAKGRAARRHGVASTPVLLFLALAPQLRDWPRPGRIGKRKTFHARGLSLSQSPCSGTAARRSPKGRVSEPR